MKRSSLVVLLIAAAVSLSAQSVISAHSGTIHYTEGQVALDGTAVQPKFGEFPEVKIGQVLSAQDGRAEILLTPGVFLRLGENSAFKMISNQLTNTRLEITSGEAMIEVGELLPDNAITVVFHGADIAIAKRGLYRIDSDPARLRVYEGEASVVSASMDPMKVGKGRELVFGEAKLEAKNFDTKATDEFYRWGARRDEYVAQANISAAKSARDSGYSGMGYSGMGMTGGTGAWAWNPWFGMFTYLPNSGMYNSPYGFGYFSPYAVGYMYGPYSPYAYGNGYAGGITSGAGGIGRGAVAPSAAPNTTSLGITRAAGFNGGMSSPASSGGGGRGGFGGAASGGGGASVSQSGGFGGGGGISGGGGVSHGGGASGGASAGGAHH
jgi:hypothetical protein